jgi:toxin ParE1/3/4
MSNYVLSKETQKDIDEIFEFGVYKFGHHQALNYLIDLGSNFKTLSENPNIGKKRDEIKQGLYSLPFCSHIIFYRILPTHIRIVRVLHGSKDLSRHF